MIFDFGWLARLFYDRQHPPHCLILPNHTPRKDGSCKRYVNCKTTGRTKDPRCLHARERAFALGDGFMSKKKGKKKSEETAPTVEELTKAAEVKLEEAHEATIADAKAFNADNVLAAMASIKGGVTSTALRDHFGLDKESGRDKIRRIMKKLEKDGKVKIAVKEGAKRKQFVYVLM